MLVDLVHAAAPAFKGTAKAEPARLPLWEHSPLMAVCNVSLPTVFRNLLARKIAPKELGYIASIFFCSYFVN